LWLTAFLKEQRDGSSPGRREIERLKKEISLERLVAARGVELVKTGANLVGLCPFHEDKNTPNFIVTPEKNVFHCFACNASGSVIDWVMKIQPRDDRDLHTRQHPRAPSGAQRDPPRRAAASWAGDHPTRAGNNC